MECSQNYQKYLFCLLKIYDKACVFSIYQIKAQIEMDYKSFFKNHILQHPNQASWYGHVELSLRKTPVLCTWSCPATEITEHWHMHTGTMHEQNQMQSSCSR